MLESIKKTDKFYVAFIVILVLLSILLIVTFRTIFTAYINAYEVNPSDISTKSKVDVKLLNEAYEWINKK